jgi:hypothetical protein
MAQTKLTDAQIQTSLEFLKPGSRSDRAKTHREVAMSSFKDSSDPISQDDVSP